jgi:drug/metabolite transporter (DMT)-like permease
MRPSALAVGPALALGSAALFGLAAPGAKLLLDAIDPWMLAGLLYLGAGLGLGLLLAVRRLRSRPPAAAPLSRREAGWLAAAILCGGAAGPVLLMVGLAMTPASSASLLLNLEGVLTALIAWFVFGENFDRRIATGMLLIAGGAVLLSWGGAFTLRGLLGPLAIVGACLAWAVDNNFTRKVALADPVRIAALKGLAGGAVNLALALLLGASLPSPGDALAGAALGFLAVGVSLVLFIKALGLLGTARTGAYYSTAPFVGAVLGVAALGEPLTPALGAAALMMAAGVWLHLTERHEHEHEHAAMAHSHRHVHDQHHRHTHGPDDPPGEPHTHRHVHVRLRHRHAHYPDAHHQHSH